MLALSDPITINGMKLKNRMVRAATLEMMATPDGGATEDHVRLYENLAQGGVGLIITGATYINEGTRLDPSQNGIHQDSLIPKWQKVTEAVHRNGGKIGMQIVHFGRIMDPKANGNRRPKAPSSLPCIPFMSWPKGMSEDEIWETIHCFGAAASRVKASGFDAVEIHAGHGYLISNFLSPMTNLRMDGWGGSPRKRFRFLKEVYRAVRSAVGPDFPVLCKMNMDDYIGIGFRPRFSYPVVQRLEAEGVDALEITGGTFEVSMLKAVRGGMPADVLSRGFNPIIQAFFRATCLLEERRNPFYEAYFADHARNLKRLVDIPLILVGGIRSRNTAEQILQEGTADLVSMCRPLIRDSNLPNKWLEGSEEDCSVCQLCNRCLGEVSAGNRLRCYAGTTALPK